MESQFIPNGTFVVFNKSGSFRTDLPAALCVVTESGTGEYDSDTVYHLRVDESAPDIIKKEYGNKGDGFWCHVKYIEYADRPFCFSAADLSKLL